MATNRRNQENAQMAILSMCNALNGLQNEADVAKVLRQQVIVLADRYNIDLQVVDDVRAALAQAA